MFTILIHLLQFVLLPLHQGWGCGYRTLQTMCSWIQQQQSSPTASAASTASAGTTAPVRVPSIPIIQQALVTMGDKPSTFLESKDWIGSFEVCIVIDHFYNVSIPNVSSFFL